MEAQNLTIYRKLSDALTEHNIKDLDSFQGFFILTRETFHIYSYITAGCINCFRSRQGLEKRGKFTVITAKSSLKAGPIAQLVRAPNFQK
jgi:hypothetical protein